MKRRVGESDVVFITESTNIVVNQIFNGIQNQKHKNTEHKNMPLPFI